MRERLLTSKELNQLMIDAIKLIDGDEKFLPKTDEFKGWSDLRIEIGPHGYEYIGSERGIETFRNVPLDLDDLLYMVFKDVTSSMAWFFKYESGQIEDDMGPVMFNKQIELMERLSPKWAERMKK